MSWGDDDTIFHVVINNEEQYSIWPAYKLVPGGWREAGKSGDKASCLCWIDQEWTDMRPLSLRKVMDAAADAQRIPSNAC